MNVYDLVTAYDKCDGLRLRIASRKCPTETARTVYLTYLNQFRDIETGEIVFDGYDELKRYICWNFGIIDGALVADIFLDYKYAEK